jgi:hypothetical protein
MGKDKIGDETVTKDKIIFSTMLEPFVKVWEEL